MPLRCQHSASVLIGCSYRAAPPRCLPALSCHLIPSEKPVKYHCKTSGKPVYTHYFLYAAPARAWAPTLCSSWPSPYCLVSSIYLHSNLFIEMCCELHTCHASCITKPGTWRGEKEKSSAILKIYLHSSLRLTDI